MHNLIIQYQNILLSWGERNTKSYPWRQTNDPYIIIVAEFILHRTQVKQAEKVFSAFVNRYPTLKAFATASSDDAEEILKPLGLHWRIRGMINALIIMWHDFREIPLDQESLESISGIGPYIAGATICFSQNRSLPLVDTNTVRVIGRIFGLDLHGEARRRKEVINAITQVCHPSEPRKYYYALIDLAHMICRLKDPYCSNCPLLSLPCNFSKIRRTA